MAELSAHRSIAVLLRVFLLDGTLHAILVFVLLHSASASAAKRINIGYRRQLTLKRFHRQSE